MQIEFLSALVKFCEKLLQMRVGYIAFLGWIQRGWTSLFRKTNKDARTVRPYLSSVFYGFGVFKVSRVFKVFWKLKSWNLITLKPYNLSINIPASS